jgi:hypothetical protein
MSRLFQETKRLLLFLWSAMLLASAVLKSISVGTSLLLYSYYGFSVEASKIGAYAIIAFEFCLFTLNLLYLGGKEIRFLKASNIILVNAGTAFIFLIHHVYTIYYLNITDCGCFGDVSILTSAPYVLMGVTLFYFIWFSVSFVIFKLQAPQTQGSSLH